MPPSIKCPRDIVAETEKGQNYAYVNWTTPEVTDNADASPILWTKPHIVFPWKAKIGMRIVVYIAQDVSGNKARCKFKVKVVGKLHSETNLARESVSGIYITKKYIESQKVDKYLTRSQTENHR